MKRRLLLFLLLIITLNINAQRIFPDTAFVKAAGGLNFPEGPAWDGSNLYISNCYSNWIAKIQGDLLRIEIADTNGKSKAVYLSKDEAAAIGIIGEGSRPAVISIDGRNGDTASIFPREFGETDSSRAAFNTDNEAAAMDVIGGEDGPTVIFITERKADTLLAFPPELDTAASNGLTFSSNGYMYACDYKGGRILRIDPLKLSIEVLVPGFNGKRFNRPNDLAFSPDGILYFTDPKSYDRNNRDGAVYSYNTDNGKLLKAAEGLAFPNGIAFSNDGKALFVCESAMERIVKFPVNADGSLGGLSEFIKLPGGDPDGIAFDENGNLYAAHFGGSAVYVINPEGKIIEKLSTPGKKPSNLEFGGKDMRDLYLTEDETNSVYLIRTNIPGRILFSSPLQNK